MLPGTASAHIVKLKYEQWKGQSMIGGASNAKITKLVSLATVKFVFNGIQFEFNIFKM